MDHDTARAFFRAALAWVNDHHAETLDRIRHLGPETFVAMSANEFLRKHAWVVYASGFKEEVVRRRFPHIAAAFLEFDLESVARMESLDTVLAVFRNPTKANSVVRTARLIQKEGYPAFKQRVRARGTDELATLPGIGQITKKHLARNLGLEDIAKDDVWLVRLVGFFGAESTDSLARFLAGESNEKVGTVDFILWRFCASSAWLECGHASLEAFISAMQGQGRSAASPDRALGAPTDAHFGDTPRS